MSYRLYFKAFWKQHWMSTSNTTSFLTPCQIFFATSCQVTNCCNNVLSTKYCSRVCASTGTTWLLLLWHICYFFCHICVLDIIQLKAYTFNTCNSPNYFSDWKLYRNPMSTVKIKCNYVVRYWYLYIVNVDDWRVGKWYSAIIATIGFMMIM